MLQKLRPRLTYANVTATIALFVALGGTGAWATHEVILSSDIVDGEVKTPDLANLGVTNPKLAANAVTSPKLAPGSVGLQDLAPNARDGCPGGTTRFGDICARAAANGRNWGPALDFCASLGLRVPSLTEASALGRKHDVPGIEGLGKFWTDEAYGTTAGGGFPQFAFMSDEDGALFSAGNVENDGAKALTVCVTDLSDGG